MSNSEGYTVQWFKGTEKVEKSERMKSVKSGGSFKLDFKVRFTSSFIPDDLLRRRNQLFQAVESTDEGVYVVKVIKDKKAVAKYAAAVLVEP